MKILVTGAAGFIGSHLCEALLKQGHDVVGVDNMNQFYDPEIKKLNSIEVERVAAALKKEFPFYEADIRHQQQMRAIMVEHQIELIVHLAAMAGVRPSMEKPTLYQDVNQIGTLALLEEAKALNIKKLVFASSSSVYGNNSKVPFSESDAVDQPISHYASTKRAGELSCHVYHKIYGFSVACLRFFTVFGPRQRPDLAIHKFTRLLFKGENIPVYGDGTFSRDFTYIEDIIAGVVGACNWVAEGEPKYEIFNLGESRPISVNDLLAQLEGVTGLKVNRETHPPVPGDVSLTYADVSKAKAMLGYNPKWKFEDGLKEFVAWFKKRHGL